MADLERIGAALKKADAAGNTEDAKKLAAAYRAEQQRQQAPKSSGPYDDGGSGEYRGSALDRFARGTGSGAADILGAPADAMNWALDKVGLGSDRPWLGSDNIRRGLAAMGSAPQEGVDQAASETVAGQLGQGLGNGVGLLAPWLGAGRAATQARAAETLVGSGASSGKRVLANAVKEAGQRPGMLAAGELGGNVGATAGRMVAEENDMQDGSVGSTLAQVAGGAAGAIAPAGAAKLATAGANASQLSLLRKVPESIIERARVQRGGEYSGGTLDNAAKTLQGQASDLSGARASVRNAEPDSGLSGALQSGDSGLMAVENRLAGATPAGQQAQRQAQDAAAGRASDAIADTGGNVPLSRTAEELQRRQAGTRQMAQQRTQQTQQRAQQATNDLGPAVPRAEASRSFDANLQDASREARGAARQQWDEVDSELVVPADGILGAVRQATDEIGEAGRVFGGEVPGPLQRLMSNAPKNQPVETTVGEMQNLRRILGQRARDYSNGANPDRNRARIMQDMVRAIDDDLAQAPTETGIQDAIGATRQVYDRFGRDGVARSLARSGTGGEMVQPEQTLERILPLGSQGSSTAGAAGARQIYDAIGTRTGARSIDGALNRELTGELQQGGGYQLPESSNARAIQNDVESYLSGEFLRRAAPEGQLSAQNARKFLRDNQSTLDLPQFSDLKTRLRTAADMSARGEMTEARQAALFDRMKDPSQSRAAMFMGRDTADGTYQNAIQNVTRGDAGDNMRQLVRQVRKDQTGEALNGLKSGFTRHMLSEVRGNDGLPDAARLNRIFGDSSPRDMSSNDAGLQRAARELFNQTDRRRIRQAADTIGKVQQSRAAGSTDADLSGGGVNRLTNFAAAALGAKGGSMIHQAMGGGSASGLVFAGRGASAVQDMVGKLLRSPVEQALSDAVKDPALFRALLERSPGSSNIPKLSDASGRSFGGWLVQLPMYSAGEEDGPELDSAAEDLEEYR